MKTEVLSELETIRQRHGGLLRPADVERFARNTKTALHARFTWDNDVAGYQYRLWEARQLIRVTVSVMPGTERSCRTFVSLMDDRTQEGGGYRITADLLSDEEGRQRLLDEALEELEVFRRKYRNLKELAAVFAEMDKIAAPKKRKQIA